MNRMQKIRSFLIGVGMLACAVAMMAYPGQGIYAVMLLLGTSLFLRGLRKVVYFFTMARFMVYLATATCDSTWELHARFLKRLCISSKQLWMHLKPKYFSKIHISTLRQTLRCYFLITQNA